MDSIEYKGNIYPIREFEVEELDYAIVVAPLSLYMELELDDDLDNYIDEQITFYLDDSMTDLPADVICREHLDEPFTLIQEL